MLCGATQYGGRALAVGQAWHQRQPHVALPGGAEERARCDEDSLLEQATRERLRQAVHREPEEERRIAAGEPQACGLERRQERFALAAIDRAHRLDMRLVRPRDDRRALDELLR